MAKRMSNASRIQQKAVEAAVKPSDDKSKDEVKKTVKKKASTSRKKASAKTKTSRMKLVYKVFNVNHKEVGCFPHTGKGDAEALAEQLTEKSGNRHFANAVRIPIEE